MGIRFPSALHGGGGEGCLSPWHGRGAKAHNGQTLTSLEALLVLLAEARAKDLRLVIVVATLYRFGHVLITRWPTGSLSRLVMRIYLAASSQLQLVCANPSIRRSITLSNHWGWRGLQDPKRRGQKRG